LAGALDRLLYALGRARRGPIRRARARAAAGARAAARALLEAEEERAGRGLSRIDGVSQLATSLGLFGTVVGIAQGFLARGGEGDPTRSLTALGEGLSTALFTTIAGLFVFLFGQVVLLLYREWLAHVGRAARELLATCDGERR
ncbi:MAG: MotA/TolQ/ExbB proton channel family protein, partial [Planctomycetota bacterium]|nr:MotA/TolQ/ExbB proton channel family protein [Planctomycetota bacterium]